MATPTQEQILAKAREVATSLSLGTIAPPANVDMLDDPFVNVSDMPIDSAEHALGFTRNTVKLFLTVPGTLTAARAVLKPKRGMATRNNWRRFWYSTLKSLSAVSPKYANFGMDVDKWMAIGGKYEDASPYHVIAYFRLFSILGISTRSFTKDKSPVRSNALFMFALFWYSQEAQADVLKSVKSAIAKGKNYGEKFVAAWNPFLNALAKMSPYGAMNMTMMPDWGAAAEGANPITAFAPKTMIWRRRFNLFFGLSDAEIPEWGEKNIGGSFVAASCNIMTARLSLPQAWAALLAIRNCAIGDETENKQFTKAVMFFYVAMEEVKENPNSGWKSVVDGDASAILKMWEDNKYEPVFIHAKMQLYTLVGLEAGENTPEMTATFFKWWLGIAQFPASASYVNDMKNRIKHDSSPGQIGSTLLMYQDLFRANGESNFNIWSFSPSSTLANLTPGDLLRAHLSHVQHEAVKPVFQQWYEFWGFRPESDFATKVGPYLDGLDKSYYEMRDNVKANVAAYFKSKM